MHTVTTANGAQGAGQPVATAGDGLPAQRGRGAGSNRAGCFEGLRRVASDENFAYDGDARGDRDEPAPLRTTVIADSTRSIIARNVSPDLGFDRSINPYRGCEHGCVYCFARPTHAFLGLSPGLDFESKLFVKPEAARLLERELRRPNYECRMMALGTNTDPYQPIERSNKITRQILEVLAAFKHPVGIVTKSALVVRDIDILAPMAAKGLAQVMLSVTTLDRRIARRMEPRASTPGKRLEAVTALAKAGIPCGVMVAPIVPGLTDAEIESILEAAAWAGATRAGCILLRLPRELKELFGEWLAANEPARAHRVMSLVRQTRGGKSYEAEFGRRMRGSGPYAELIARRFTLSCRRLGLNRRPVELDTSRFRVPEPAGDQLTLL